MHDPQITSRSGSEGYSGPTGTVGLGNEKRVLDGIRQGIEDMHSGRGRPGDEVFAEIRREFNISPAPILNATTEVTP